MDRAAKQWAIERLREQIRRLQAEPRTYLAALRTGWAPLDALFPAGGWPLGHALELSGEAASGRTTLALSAIAAAQREKRLAAYVDGPGELYPVGAVALGVSLAELLIARPKDPKQLVWTAVQLARSGAFACVVLDLTHTAARLSPWDAKKLLDGARAGASLVLAMGPASQPAQGLPRLKVEPKGWEGFEVFVEHGKWGGSGARAFVRWNAIPRGVGAAGRLAPDGEGQEGAGELARAPRLRPQAARNGPIGIVGQRPGRDASFPSLAQSLGILGLRGL